MTPFLAAQFYEQYCNFNGIDEFAEEELLLFRSYIIDFFSQDYLEILESSEFHIIYHFDQRWTFSHHGGFIGEGEEEEDEVSWGKDEDLGHAHGGAVGHAHSYSRITTWKEVITSTNMYGFDQIVAISQASLNNYFNTLFTVAQTVKASDYHAALAKWDYEQYFSAAFKPITLRLLSNGKAIIWFHLESGHLKTLRNWLPWSGYVTVVILWVTLIDILKIGRAHV